MWFFHNRWFRFVFVYHINKIRKVFNFFFVGIFKWDQFVYVVIFNGFLMVWWVFHDNYLTKLLFSRTIFNKKKNQHVDILTRTTLKLCGCRCRNPSNIEHTNQTPSFNIVQYTYIILPSFLFKVVCICILYENSASLTPFISNIVIGNSVAIYQSRRDKQFYFVYALWTKIFFSTILSL